MWFRMSHRPLVMRSPLAVRLSLPNVAGNVASAFVRQAGAMVVDRFDRKLINDKRARRS
jgi:hypothetical protein